MNTAHRSTRSRTRRKDAPAGFTLIEASMATVIIGVGVLAMVDAQTAFIRSNQWSSHAASATFLANEIREMTRRLPNHDPVNGLYLDESGAEAVLMGWGPDAGESTVDDFDDIDDFDGLTFSHVGTAGFADGDLPGPINAFGEVIPHIDLQGEELGETINNEFQGQAMSGWSQRVIVEKVDPFDTSTVYADSYSEDPDGDFPGRNIDEFPLRITVQVFYQGPSDVQPELISEVVWIQP